MGRLLRMAVCPHQGESELLFPSLSADFPCFFLYDPQCRQLPYGAVLMASGREGMTDNMTKEPDFCI